MPSTCAPANGHHCYHGNLVLAAGFYPNGVLELTRVASEDWIGRLITE
jgi:hypothetical protein